MTNPCPKHDVDTYIGCPTCPQPSAKHVRLFHLQRIEDETGISGTGRVADGVVFPDGHAVIRWRTSTSSTGCYDSVADVEHIHGHNGKTIIVWDDAEMVPLHIVRQILRRRILKAKDSTRDVLEAARDEIDSINTRTC